MAGSVLGADQVAKVNAAYPRLLSHLSALLGADSTAYGRMKVHFLTEFLDTTELALVFKDLSFLAPAEKRALVRAAIYEVLSSDTLPVPAESNVVVNTAGQVEKREERTFTPAPFKLNVNSTSAFHPRPADVSVAKPVITSTHTSKVAEAVQAGNQEMAHEQAKRDVAVAKIRESVQPIEIAPAVDADIPQAGE